MTREFARGRRAGPGVGELGEPLLHPTGPFLGAQGRGPGTQPFCFRRGEILAYRLAIHPEAAGDLGDVPARLPVLEDLHHVDHVKRPPCQMSPPLGSVRRGEGSRQHHGNDDGWGITWRSGWGIT
jgi:hypothetical protein